MPAVIVFLESIPLKSSQSTAPPGAATERFCQQHYRLIATLALALAAFNLGFRLNREVVTAWDESLYATTAAEMLDSGNWLVTTFHGSVDYYNAKPPLNAWLIATSFRAFGVSLVALRLPSVVAAWITIFVLQWWCRRCFGAAPAILATLVLSTMFGFLYVHSARSGNPDALFTLLVLLTVITLWSARVAPRRLVWLGPLAAAAFLLKGTGVVLPVAIVLGVQAWRGVTRREAGPLAVGATLFAMPVLAWGVARWRFDGWRFFEKLLGYDFVARTTRPLEGHDGTLVYYLNVLQKDHYDWMAAALIVLVVFAVARRRGAFGNALVAIDVDTRVLLGAWGAVTLIMPTIMPTKLAWYLNPFYPLFAAGVALVLASALARLRDLPAAWQRAVTVGVVVLAFTVAEAKLVWYSFNKRELRGSMQGLLLANAGRLEGRRVRRETWDPADQFVLEHMVHGVAVVGPVDRAQGEPADDRLVLTGSSPGPGTEWALLGDANLP